MKSIKILLFGVALFLFGITNVFAMNTGITSVNIKAKSDDIEVSAPVINGKVMESTIRFHELNDYVTFEVLLSTDEDRVITGIADNNTNEFIKTSYTYDGLKFNITLKYEKKLTGDLDLDDIHITVYFSDDTSSEVAFRQNPNTFDGIYLYLISFILSIIGLIVLFKSSKKMAKIASLVLILLPVIVFATSTVTTICTFKVEKISVEQKINISYEPNGGTGCPEGKIITKGESIGDLPQPVIDEYVLEGWYTESTFENKVDSSYVPTEDVTLHAKWLKSVKGASVSPSEIVTKINGTKTITVSNVGEEYSFSSSDDTIATVDENGVVTGKGLGTATITVTGSLSGETKTVSVEIKKELTITYEVDGGTGCPENKKILKGDSIGDLPQPTKNNYVLEGWYTESTFENKINSSYVPEDSMPIYAKWLKSVKGAMVTPTDIIAKINGTETITVSNVEEGYTFSSSDESIATVDANGVVTGKGIGTATITITGSLSGETKTVSVEVKKELTITYEANGGVGCPANKKILKGDSVGALPEPTMNNYVLEGWYADSTLNDKISSSYVPEDSMPIYAKWLKSVNGATLTPTEIVTKINGTGTITVSNVEEGYTFSSSNESIATVDANGVVTGKGLGTATITITGTLSEETKTVSVEIKKELTITYEANGGAGAPENKKILEGDSVGDLPEPTKNNFVLEGWYSDSTLNNKIDSSYVPADSMPIYAKWLKSVKGATVTPSEIVTVTGGSETIVISNVEEGYTFSSSNESIATVDGNGVVTGVTKGTVTITVTGTLSEETKTVSVEVKNEYTITYEADGGTGCPANKKIVEGDTVGALPQPTKTNYVLEGWYSDSAKNNKIDSSYVPTGSMPIYAKWLKSVSGASVTPSSIVTTAGESETIVVSNVEEGYTFSSSDQNVATVDENGVVTGVAIGTATITITGTLSEETKTVSVSIVLIDYKNRQVAGQISVGDEIAISGEHFYVVSTDGDNTTLLSKYNLYVGDIMDIDYSDNSTQYNTTILNTDSKYGLQNSAALGQHAGDTQFFGTVAFSGSKYWSDGDAADVYDSSRNGTPPDYDYNPQYGHYVGGVAQDNGYTIAYYVEQYVNRLKGMGAPDTITGRLITQAELESLGCIAGNSCDNYDYSWVFNTSYWTSSFDPGVSTSYLGFISSMNIYDYVKYSANISYGVRPVIVVHTSDLIANDEHIVKFNANGGSVSTSYRIVKDGQTIGTLPTPTHTDPTYSFDAWYTLLDSGTVVDADYLVNNDIEIFARWNITPPASTVTYETRQVPGQITVGDVISVGNEKFYVINSNATSTAVLSKYNLYVGDNIASDFSSHETISEEDAAYGLQNSLAVGAGGGTGTNYGVVAFSGSRYWDTSQAANIYNSTLNTTGQSCSNYNGTGGTADDNGYTIAYYVEQYVGKLKEMGAPDTITGRLLLASEAEDLDCMSEWMCEDTYSWVYSTSYWLGSIDQWVGANSVGFIHKNGQFDYNLYTKINQFGVRPVIVFATSDLS